MVTVAADAVAAVAAATRTVVGQVLKKSRNMSASATEIFEIVLRRLIFFNSLLLEL